MLHSGVMHQTPRLVAARPWTTVALLLFATWAWACWSCAEHWRGNPNYSFGWIVPLLVFGFAARRFNAAQRDAPRRLLSIPLVAIVGGALVTGSAIFVLEFARIQIWHPVIVIWLIAIIPVTATLLVCWASGGTRLLRAMLFPILFFLTAVPWPPRFEQPITAMLMQAVAAATTELLHWLGIQAQTAGGAIVLRTGAVGITEACSGIRSLQSGIMFGLAMGEWFLLRPIRRVALVVIAIALALLTNLGRTLALSLQAEWHGVPAVESIHDLTGNIAVSVLVLAIWVCGRLLRSGPQTFNIDRIGQRLRELSQTFPFPLHRLAFIPLIGGIAGIAAAQILSSRLEARDQTQTTPFFVLQPNANWKRVELPREVWRELHPTSGNYYRARLDRGVADSFHFFWKPSPWNRFLLVHRPDICMPGFGWESQGAPERIAVDFSPHQVQFHAFRFKREKLHALELWGVWRNGEPVSLEYQPDQVLGTAVAPPTLRLEGKRRSATEIVACSVISDRGFPEVGPVVRLMKSVLRYTPTHE